MGGALSAANLKKGHLICLVDAHGNVMTVQQDTSENSGISRVLQTLCKPVIYNYSQQGVHRLSYLSCESQASLPVKSQVDSVCVQSLQKQSFWSTGKVREGLWASDRLGKHCNCSGFAEQTSASRRAVCHLQSSWSVFAEAKRLTAAADLQVFSRL